MKAQLKQEADDREAGDLALIWNIGLPRNYLKVSDQPISQFGSSGAGDGQFQFPCSVTCKSRGEIVVADSENHRIQVFDRNGKFMFKFGSNGSGSGQFDRPRSVTVDQRNNQIVVVDTKNHRIQIFDEKGTFLRVYGSNGKGEGQSNYPFGVVDQQGNYVVTDTNKIAFRFSTLKVRL